MNIDTTQDKLACFIHSTTLDLWKDTFLIEILENLKSSELLSRMNHVCILNTGKPIDSQKIERDYYPTKVIYYSENTMDFENATIRHLHIFSKMHPDHKILYMHTKGISYTATHVFYPGVKAWNNYMMHCLLQNYKRCLRLLKVYDTVGTNYRPTEHGNGQHYSGNYWWANANYIQHLPIQYMKDKYHPEFWLLQNEPLYFNIHHIEHMYEQVYPIENYHECVERGFQDNVLYCKVGFPHTGLCNQLYNIVNTMIIAGTQEGGNKVIILDNFVKDFQTLEPIRASNVLNLPMMNDIIQSFGITLLDKHDVEMTIDKIEYGLKEVKVLDITKKICEWYYKPNHLYIPQWTDLNSVIGEDPCPQMRKQIYVYYSLNGIPLLKMFHERKLIFNGPVEICHSNYDNKIPKHVLDASEPWLTRINRDHAKELTPQFDLLLSTLRFCVNYETHVEDFLRSSFSTLSEKYNVWHVRNEDDAMKHWAKLNGISEDNYRIVYETHYIDAVRKYINKESTNIVLTSKVENNSIIERLKQEGYRIYVRPNIPDIGREMNAIVDLLMGFNCKGVFIGNINPYTMQGSTFSYVLYNHLKESNVKCLTINMDNIAEEVHEL